MPFLDLNDVSKKFNEGRYAVRKVDLSVDEHAKVGIVGETGSGKSTLLKLIGGIQQKDEGEILFEGEKVKGPEDQLIAGHQEMQYLSQHFELKEFITVSEYLDNIYLIAEEEAAKIYSACQIKHLLSKDTRHLSGGEKQRVALAKALTYEPRLLLLDEPLSNLDFHHKKSIKSVIEKVGEELGTTIMMITHEPREVLSWADEVFVMQKGEIVQKGTPRELYENPRDEYVAGLFGDYHLISPKIWGIKGTDGIPMIRKKAFVRPEQFIASKDQDLVGVKGVVKDVKYNGNFDQILMETEDGFVSLSTHVREYALEDNVWLRIKGIGS